MLVLAWVYDVSDNGIVVQADATDTVVIPFGGRKADFSVIGVLAVALIFSVYLNLTGGPEFVEELGDYRGHRVTSFAPTTKSSPMIFAMGKSG